VVLCDRNEIARQNSEERYQTAPVVENDLRRCLAEWKSDGSISDFSLANMTSRSVWLIHEKLYGRAREIDHPTSLRLDRW
jgi:hypothetical protein